MKSYPLDQCALYKVTSKRRLTDILRIDLKRLTRLSQDEGNFNVFEMPEAICPFTGKKTKARWVQNPIPELKDLHRRIQALLNRVEVPAFCHGGTKGKSYRTNAAVHLMAPSVATFDLRSFFPSTSSKQVFGFFQHDLDCAPDVAGLLTDLCTYRRCLATGSPVSPILAYWANRKLFETLNRRATEQHLMMSVYVDDVTISGDLLPHRLAEQVDGIVKKYGHQLSVGKTRRFLPGDAKHVTGIVIKGGQLRVPFSRFHKARAISAAIVAAPDDLTREVLTAKLGGLLGEAAYIDPRYKRWAEQTYAQLAAIRIRRRL